MKFSAQPVSNGADPGGTDCRTILLDDADQPIAAPTAELTAALAPVLGCGAFGKTAYQNLLVPLSDSPLGRALLLYRLPNSDLSRLALWAFGDGVANHIAALNFPQATLDLSVFDPEKARAMAESVVLSMCQLDYRYTEFKSTPPPKMKLQHLRFLTQDPQLAETLKSAQILGEAINFARRLGDTPGNHCTPTDLADTAVQLAADHSAIETHILGELQMQKLGMGALLSVAAGSQHPARLIVMKYCGTRAKIAPHVLVGKGITFDSGGITLKPGPAMDEMKFDMCGAASVFAAMQATARSTLPINLVGIVAAAENMPGGRATKPGDVVRSMAGKTIEILNTDAEGRLVLCDALAYAAKFKPASLIDIATLTGACVVALGHQASGLYANDDALAEALLAAGERIYDRAWRMPLWTEYKAQLESKVADLANIAGRGAGSVTAACFLSHFTSEQKWAHLDVAGTAWHRGDTKGATGRPVSLLVEYLRSCAQAA